jgi:hypothetical protein
VIVAKFNWRNCGRESYGGKQKERFASQSRALQGALNFARVAVIWLDECDKLQYMTDS